MCEWVLEFDTEDKEHDSNGVKTLPWGSWTKKTKELSVRNISEKAIAFVLAITVINIAADDETPFTAVLPLFAPDSYSFHSASASAEEAKNSPTQSNSFTKEKTN